MLQVGCGSVGLILPCAISTAAADAAAASPNKKFLISPSSLISGPDHALIDLRDGAHTFIEEALHARAGVGLGGVEVTLRISIQVMDAEELARLPSSIPEG